MKTKHAVGIAVLLWAAIFLPGLGSTELKGEEWRRVLPGRTMLQTGDWMQPYSGGKIYNRKPPLINWSAAISFKLAGGESEFAARLPSVLSVLMLVLVTIWSLSNWLRPSGALAAAIFMMTNIGLLEKGRLAEIEPLYISLYGIAILVWVGSYQRRLSPWLTWAVPGVALGLANLAKGPAPLLLFYYAPIICVLFKAKRLKFLLHPAHFAGIGLMLLIFLAWAIPAAGANTEGDSGAVWLEQIASRLGFDEMEPASWVLQPFQALVNYLPWVLFIPLLWKRRYSGDAGAVECDRALLRGLRMGLVISFVAIAFLPTSRPRFTLPLLVPASVLIAWLLAKSPSWVSSLPGNVWRGVLRYLGWVLVAAVVVAAGIGLWSGAFLLVVSAVPGVIVGVWAWRRRKANEQSFSRLAIASAGLACLIVAAFTMAAVPIMANKENIRPFGHRVVDAAGGRDIVAYKVGEKPFVFYLGETTREYGHWEGQLEDHPVGEVAILLPSDKLEGAIKKLEKRFGEPVAVHELPYTRSGKADDREDYRLLVFGEAE